MEPAVAGQGQPGLLGEWCGPHLVREDCRAAARRQEALGVAGSPLRAVGSERAVGLTNLESGRSLSWAERVRSHRVTLVFQLPRCWCRCGGVRRGEGLEGGPEVGERRGETIRGDWKKSPEGKVSHKPKEKVFPGQSGSDTWPALLWDRQAADGTGHGTGWHGGPEDWAAAVPAVASGGSH